MLTITTPADNRSLLTPVQLRIAAGLAADDTSRDDELVEIGVIVSDTISEWCNVAGDGVTPVTLMQETIVETFYPEIRSSSFFLARRFLGDVTVVEGGVTLTVGNDYTIEGNQLTRRSSGSKICWPGALTIVVTYEAGFADVPSTLAAEAAKLVAKAIAGGASTTDPMLKTQSVNIPGVLTESREYWTGSEVSPDMVERLSRYRSGLVW